MQSLCAIKKLKEATLLRAYSGRRRVRPCQVTCCGENGQMHRVDAGTQVDALSLCWVGGIEMSLPSRGNSFPCGILAGQQRLVESRVR